MRDMDTIKFVVRGPFQVLGPDGIDLTPRGRKERGLLALLVFSPNHTRSRSWLQDKLWSDRFADQANTSLRRALSNIRKSLGSASAHFISDRTNVRLSQDVNVDFRKDQIATLEILEDLDIPDPEFEHWIRDTRVSYGNSQSVAQSNLKDNKQIPLIHIIPLDKQETPELRFLEEYLCSTLADRLNILGEIDVIIGQPGEPPIRRATSVIEVNTLAANAEWFIHLRIRGGYRQNLMWSGRLRLGMNVGEIWKGPELSGFLAQTISAVIEKNALHARGVPYFAIQSAARRLFTGRQTDLNTANAALDLACEDDKSGIAFAWRSFSRLTEILEFGGGSEIVRGEAMQFADEALVRSQCNPLVSALAAQVHLKLNNDLDYGVYLAQSAVDACDQNPYSLDALSQASFIRGEFELGDRLAQWSRRSAGELPNAFIWDMQCCLSALGLGRLDEARNHAATCHLRMPYYRPALRYLFAIHLLLGRNDEAKKYLSRLGVVEEGTNANTFLQPDYPMDSLRNLGLMDDLRSAIIAID